nr:MAG TPA: hypothetical protein [Caudoviricetes sp.]
MSQRAFRRTNKYSLKVNKKVMKYVIVTVEWCLNHGVVVPAQARRSVDGLKVILHEDYIDPVLREDDDMISYRHDSSELRSILSGPEWTVPQEGVL